MMKGHIIAGMLLVACASIVHAQAPARDSVRDTTKKVDYRYRYRFLGVYDAQTGDPIEGVEVSDVVSGMKATTTKTGTVSLLFLPDGGSLVRIRKLGYEVQTMPVSITPADTAPVTVVLEHATTLATTVVNADSTKHTSAHMATFEEHKKQGQGQFVDEAAFRKADNSTMANFLSSRLAGMTTVAGPHGTTFFVSARTQCQGPVLLGGRCNASNYCYVNIYTDGVRTWDRTMGVSALPDMARLSPQDYAAAEYYPGGSALPEGISPTNSNCGTLVLYRREQ